MSKLGRNESCHCGSGKKYKKCCLGKDEQEKLTLVTEQEETEDWDYEAPPYVFTNKNPSFSDYENADFAEEDIEESIFSKPYPEISEEEEDLVDGWWDKYDNLKDPDDIRNHLESFMKNHPNLVENLGLEAMVLFELGADYREDGRIDEYIELLQKIRKEFPSTYERSACYYDYDIIAWLIANKRESEINNYFNYFELHPKDFAEHIILVSDLMLATGNADKLFPLIAEVSQDILNSETFFTDVLITKYLLFEIQRKYLNSESDVKGLVEEVSASKELTERIVSGLEVWKPIYSNIFREFTLWPQDALKNKKDLHSRYEAMKDNFIRYIHDTKNISWEEALFYADVLFFYFINYINNKKCNYKKLFNFSYGVMKDCVLQSSSSFNSSGVKYLSTLNSLYYFAEYLFVCGNFDEKEKNKVQENCKLLRDEAYPEFLLQDTEALCFPEFPFWG